MGLLSSKKSLKERSLGAVQAFKTAIDELVAVNKEAAEQKMSNKAIIIAMEKANVELVQTIDSNESIISKIKAIIEPAKKATVAELENDSSNA